MILFYHDSFSFFLIIDLHVLIPAVITQILKTIAEFVIPIRIPTKQANVEMEIHGHISRQYNSKLYNHFYASYSLIHFDLFP